MTERFQTRRLRPVLTRPWLDWNMIFMKVGRKNHGFI